MVDLIIACTGAPLSSWAALSGLDGSMTKKLCRRWEVWEEKLVAKHHPNYRAVLKALPHRSYSAVRARAQSLDLAPKRKRWIAATVQKALALRKIMPRREVVRHFENEPPGRIVQILHYFRARGRQRRFASTPDPIVNAILNRAWNKQYRLREIDRAIGAKRYFGARDFDYRLDPDHISRAVEHMGGELYVEWED